LLWIGVTGGLHLDGLADLSDAMGAAHRSRERFSVLKDPHVGSFGVIALICAIVSKLVLLMLLASQPQQLPGLLLLPAWARLFALFWSATLPALAPGSGERFAWQPQWRAQGHRPAGLWACRCGWPRHCCWHRWPACCGAAGSSASWAA
jgi:adenosylcobinamide-GDP ribazoletransferase